MIYQVFFVFLLIFFICILFYNYYFLRTPKRKIPYDNNLFVSPANWKIIAVIKQNELKSKKNPLYKKNSEVIDDWTKGFEEWATLISIMMTPFDAHYQKAPMLSTLIDEEYEEGRLFNAMKSGEKMSSTFQNEYNSLLFKTPENYKFRIIQIAWFFARRIVDYIEIDQEIKQWDTIGLIKFWSQVSIILDKHFEIIAKKWDKVIDWETILAKKKVTK